MYFAEIYGGRVSAIVDNPAYAILPPNCIEITAGMDVQVGYVFDQETRTVHLPTQEELNAIYRPAFNTERNRLFAATEWVRQRHADQVELGINDAANWDTWLNYWQALRDLPDQPDFDALNPVWPEMPE